MGADPYLYVTSYEGNVKRTLEKLRSAVFERGDYRGASQKPSTMEEALEMAGESGTGSILDIFDVSDQPEYCMTAPLSSEELLEIFGTLEPERSAEVEASDALWGLVERGMCRHVVLYESGEPRSVLFAWYSFD